MQEFIERLTFELSTKRGLEDGRGVSAPGNHLYKDMKRKKHLESMRIVCDIGCSRNRVQGMMDYSCWAWNVSLVQINKNKMWSFLPLKAL